MGAGFLVPSLFGYAYAPIEENKKVFAHFLQGFWRFPTKFQRFKKQCCALAEDRAIFEDLRLRGQGQGLQNVSSRPRTSSRTPPLSVMTLAKKYSKYNVLQLLVEMLLLQNKPWLISIEGHKFVNRKFVNNELTFSLTRYSLKILFMLTDQINFR